jgi:hypothetical protein
LTYDPDAHGNFFHNLDEPALVPYHHAGDLDCFKHGDVYYLVLPLTGPDRTPAVAFFRADTLSLVNYAELDPSKQTDVGWCAVHPITGDLYTSRDDPDSFLQYKIHWDRLFDRTRHDALELSDSHPIALMTDQALHNMQGGEFSPSGKLLYINSGVISACACNPFGTAAPASTRCMPTTAST